MAAAVAPAEEQEEEEEEKEVKRLVEGLMLGERGWRPGNKAPDLDNIGITDVVVLRETFWLMEEEEQAVVAWERRHHST